MVKAMRCESSRRWFSRKFPDKAQWPRIKRLLRFSGVVCIIHGLTWGFYYATHAMSVMALLLFALVLLGVGCIFVAKRFELFSLSLIAHVFLIIAVFASLADVPSAYSARSAHLFLLPIGISAFFLFRSDGFYLRWVFPVVCFSALVVISNYSLDLGPHLELLPADVSKLGHDLNRATAIALTICVLAIFREDLSSKVESYRSLARAVSQRELCSYMQPQVAIDGKVIGAEVLLRWNRPGYGVQSPAEFIPLAEETGLINEIGLMVIEDACRHLKSWSVIPSVNKWVLSVNVSPLQLASQTFVEDVREIMRKVGVSGDKLCLEITESVFASDLNSTASKMKALSDDGISWSLDDFGTGFSSLSLLQTLPLHELKIDQSFIFDIENDASKRELVRKIIEIADILGVSTIAEGIETKQQREYLESMGCAAFQGYLFGRPIVATEFLTEYRPALNLSVGSSTG